jgi:1,4-dihydroxy-6-naphthoate synthase
MLLNIHISPCPNDTFLFFPFLSHLVEHSFVANTTFADIEDLNRAALSHLPDLVKVSYAVVPELLDHYELLPVGSALGFGNGPKIVAARPCDLNELASSRLVIPGRHTTAYQLYKRLCPEAREEMFAIYHEIPHYLQTGKADMGLIIHETRFTLKKLGLYEVCDLGALWETKTSLPLPLGGLMGKKSLGLSTLASITKALQASLRYAWDHPHEGMEFILEKAQEKDPKVVQSHIDLYVNETTLELSKQAKQAIHMFLYNSPYDDLTLHSPDPM